MNHNVCWSCREKFLPSILGSAGVTLVELLVIMVIIGILAGFSGTALMKWIPQANLSRAARTVVSMAQHAKQEAIKRNQAVNLNCSAAANTCTIVIGGNAARIFNLSTLRSNVTLTSSPQLAFNGRGRASSANNVWVATITNGAGTRNVRVRTSGSVITE